MSSHTKLRFIGTALLVALAGCHKGPDPQKLGVFAETNGDIIAVNSFATENEEDTIDEGLLIIFRFAGAPASTGSVRSFYINLPDANVSESKLFWLDDLNVKWHAEEAQPTDPQPLNAQLTKTDSGVYQIGSEELGSKRGGYAALWVKMPMGTPDRLYALEVKGD